MKNFTIVIILLLVLCACGKSSASNSKDTKSKDAKSKDAKSKDTRMHLHQTKSIVSDWEVIKVPGGWVYGTYRAGVVFVKDTAEKDALELKILKERLRLLKEAVEEDTHEGVTF